MRELDLTLFRAINEGPDWLEPVMVFFSEGTKQWPVRIALLALFIFLVWRPKTRKPALLAMVAWPVANAACEWLKYGLRAPRPSAELADAIVRVERLTSFGTSSAHSATMMAVAVAFLFYHRPLGYAWLAVALVTGYSRAYVGVHYPYQVLVGWLVGGFVSFVVVKTWQAVERVRAARAGEAASRGAGQ